jgi:hypothetical protein
VSNFYSGHATHLCPKEVALTSLTIGCRSVGKFACGLNVPEVMLPYSVMMRTLPDEKWVRISVEIERTYFNVYSIEIPA